MDKRVTITGNTIQQKLAPIALHNQESELCSKKAQLLIHYFEDLIWPSVADFSTSRVAHQPKPSNASEAQPA